MVGGYLEHPGQSSLVDEVRLDEVPAVDPNPAARDHVDVLTRQPHQALDDGPAELD